ncbi:LysR family transcriptional regulator, glycine cleavage system transcriptional activator [Salinihabitans flavidus]|uniref:LysR family transcriptional regulator, glycine cleavage system transcriptional activator n=1 Tax=Salinihabitans flavidus TaxID=569882 RepID=A0A1H8WFP2_9RHOB|nr:LysR substrate-binding domain-containing protein [Salinihabitans flavidus]SEP26446.1 LysR family transcriptional regulator, glycine cleavage system transcriptional activator [Salinihabitans flavidus]
MGRKLPPFAAVRAFEATARHMSVKTAADELCLTPSALSHQIKALEGFLDTQLFERSGNRIALTQTGQGYAGKLTQLLDSFQDETQAARGGAQTLRVLSTPGFAARWLVPRLPRLDFARDIRLRVSNGAPSLDFATNDADVVIQWSDRPTPGLLVQPLMASVRYPVISPALKSREVVSRPEDLLRLSLFYDETDDAWPEWFAATGLDGVDLPPGPTYPNCELSTTMVEQGQGVSLAYDAVVRGTLASGRLERLFDIVTPPMAIYAVACQEARADEPRIAAFRRWLCAEAKAEGVLPAGQPQAAE